MPTHITRIDSIDDLADVTITSVASGQLLRYNGSAWVNAGGLILPLVTKTADYTATSSDYAILCDATSGAFTVTLPAASTSGRVYAIKKIDSTGNAVTIDGNGAELVEGSANQTLDAQYEAVVIQSNGTAWFIISSN